MMAQILAIDQGTTSTRALRFDGRGRALAVSQRELSQHYPRDGWVEHDPADIWRDALTTVREVLTDDVAAIGITNQRETVVLWDRASGDPLHRAIVWQDRRTAELCRSLRADGVDITGPFAADTMFHARARAEYDAALCLYHDQALIPLKTLYFDDGVNLTLGLPIVRAAPDHGTAFGIAGTNSAHPGAMIATIELAASCAEHRAAAL